MVDPIFDKDIPPFSPNAHSDPMHQEPAPSRGRIGHALYQEASTFYSWYQWMRKISDTEEGFHALLIIMQIAHKEVLSPEEEQHALTCLKDLRYELDNVNKTIDQIPPALEQILEKLVENNTKSNVIKYATEIEMKLIHSIPGEDLSSVKGKIEKIMDKVAASYTPMEAEQLGRNLHEILHLPDKAEIMKRLHEEVFPLLDKR